MITNIVKKKIYLLGELLESHIKLHISLQRNIYGLGRTSSLEIVRKMGFNESIKLRDLTDEEKIKLENLIKNEYIVGGKKVSQVIECIKRLKKINCYRGIRLKNGLPVRGKTRNSKNRIPGRGMPKNSGIKQKRSI